MKDKFSMLGDLIKTEMVANRIFEVYEDVFGDQHGKDMSIVSKEIGKVKSVVTFIICEKGYRRLNNAVIDVNDYSSAIEDELKELEIYKSLHSLTGRMDFRGFSKMFSSEKEDEGK